jgi:hypothetical protein
MAERSSELPPLAMPSDDCAPPLLVDVVMTLLFRRYDSVV